MTMVQVQKERQCQLKVNIMSNRKKVMLTKDAPLKGTATLMLNVFYMKDLNKP